MPCQFFSLVFDQLIERFLAEPVGIADVRKDGFPLTVPASFIRRGTRASTPSNESPLHKGTVLQPFGPRTDLQVCEAKRLRKLEAENRQLKP